jgi:hypothetical protein
VRSRGSRPAGTGPPQNLCPMPAALSWPCWARTAGSLEGGRGAGSPGLLNVAEVLLFAQAQVAELDPAQIAALDATG